MFARSVAMQSRPADTLIVLNRSPVASVIVVNYIGGQLLENCLRSLSGTKFTSFEVIVVDNGSTDGSADIVADHFPFAKLIRLRRNEGYSVANNLGICAARGEYLVLLNSDIEVNPEWLSILVKVAQQKPEVAFLQPKILFLDRGDTINSAGNKIHFAGFGICRGIGVQDLGQYDRSEEIGYASGACVMVSRKALDEIGLLDEIFFTYGEDKDWGWRAKMMGYTSMYVPAARVYHKWSAVLGWSPKKMYYLELERLVSVLKNHTKRTFIVLAPILLLVELGVLLHAAAKGWLPYKILAYVHAFNFRGEIKKRRKELSHKKIVPGGLLIREFEFQLQHPYVGRLALPLNAICAVYARLLLFGQA